MSLDFVQYPSCEATDPMWEDPCYPPGPPLQPTDALSSELFDHEFDNDEEVSEFCRNLSPEQIDALFSSRDTTPAAISTKISTPSTSTNSTDSSYDIAPSQYSFSLTSSESGYLNPSEFEADGSVNSSLYSAQAFISSADTDRLPPYIPPLNPTEAHGTMELNPNFLADNYSTTVQQLESVTCVDPAALSFGPVHVISDPESKEQMKAQMAQFKKPFKCPLCLFTSKRKHNMKTHIATHYKSKPFMCSTCGRPFTRKHDLHRHCETIHKNRMSASSVSSRRFHLKPDLPQYRTTTVSGDEQLAPSSLHPGSFSDAGMEDLTTRWEYATWLQGAS